MTGCPFGGSPGQTPDGGTPESAAAAGPQAAAASGNGSLSRRGMSRRGLLSLAGAGGAGAVAGLAAGFLGHDAVEAAAAPLAPPGDVIPFHGDRQAGIVTPAQDRLHIAAFDVVTEDRAELIRLLKDWTAAAAAMTAGRGTGNGAVDGPYDAPPEDTGETLDLGAGKLTLTFGFGAGLFEKGGTARFGLDGRRPDALIDLPHFPGDDLQPGRTGGDIVVQACADDPQVAVHAIRNLARIGFGQTRVRWSQLGFGRTSSTSRSQTTPRNLFGFKDGTNNLKAEDTALLEEHVWAGQGTRPEEGWMAGGTYLVARRIRMHIEIWDRTSLREQEALIGRTKGAGAPLSGGEEFTAPDFQIQGRSGEPLIPLDAHVRLAHSSQNNGVKMLRRGYNYTDGSDGLGHLDAGLFFIAFVTDPRTHYVPMQLAMAKEDTLAVEYLKHTGSGLFAVPPGTRAGGFIGEGLFA